MILEYIKVPTWVKISRANRSFLRDQLALDTPYFYEYAYLSFIY